MKTLIRIARRVVSYLYASNEPDFASTCIPTVHHPHGQGDEYLAGMPRRTRHLEQEVILRGHSSPLHFRYISPFIVLLIIRTLSKFR
jgi:hypothetical protein